MTIYKDAELKAYLEQAGFHDVQIHKKKSWLCITARKYTNEEYALKNIWEKQTKRVNL